MNFVVAAHAMICIVDANRPVAGTFINSKPLNKLQRMAIGRNQFQHIKVAFTTMQKTLCQGLKRVQGTLHGYSGIYSNKSLH